jgi:hypothetical protein
MILSELKYFVLKIDFCKVVIGKKSGEVGKFLSDVYMQFWKLSIRIMRITEMVQKM